MRTPRLQPLVRPGWDESTPNILGTIAHHPTLLEPFLGFAAALASRGVLPKRSAELLALRTAWNCRSSFEWGHHALYAREAGLGDDEIERIAKAPESTHWSAPDRALLRSADELHQQHTLNDDTWAELAGLLSEAQLVELVFVVGQYTMLSMLARATGVPLEPGLPPLPEG